MYGSYEANIEEVFQDGEIESPQPKQVYAKSGRHNLKQMVLLLATTGAAGFPIWMEAHSANVSDKKTLPTAAEKMRTLCMELAESPEFIYVGDSAIHSNILAYSADLFWITSVPENIKDARELVSLPRKQETFTELGNGCAYYSTIYNYGNVTQRWILFYSEVAYEREIKTLEKKIQRVFEARQGMVAFKQSGI